MLLAYKRTEVIGQGKFGVVYKGYHRQTKKVVAIKVLDLDTEYDEVVDVQQEIQFLADLKHVPNVTHYYGLFLNDTKLWIIMDYCAGGSIRTLLKAGVFEEKYISVVAREVLMALQAVHKMGVIHRDIKAANILIGNGGNVSLCDFGVAARLTSNALKRMTMAGTPFWMAPEVIREGDQYNAKADIWSLGITLYEIATGNPPYSEGGATWAMAMIEKQTPPRLEGREYPQALKECIALCLDENPEERPSAELLLKCKLIKQYKVQPTTILKEVISRYLLWRDLNSSRDSVYVTEEAVASDRDPIQVKWDFDSLSSKEYIIENDIHLSDDEKIANLSDDENGYTITTQPTYNLNSAHLSETLSASHTFSGKSSGERTQSATRSTKSTLPPKSLTSLFKEEGAEDDVQLHDESSNYNIPRIPTLLNMAPDLLLTSSPTIEIPDMESMAKLGSSAAGQTQQPSYSTDSVPKLTKPPALHHTQSASGALELGGSRQRRNTATNTLPILETRTPPRVADAAAIVSPKTPLAPEKSLTQSPSRSMRPLQQTHNPMLQPINFKFADNSEGTGSGSLASSGTSSSTSALVPAAAPVPVSAAKPKREKPSLRIQMPQPSSTVNLLSALTNDEDRNVNQFGINPALLNNVGSMTPVTEKDTQLGLDQALDSKEKAEASAVKHQQKKIATLMGPKTAPLSGAANNGNSMFFARNHPNPSVASVAPAAVPGPPKLQFPPIPSISLELFSDSTPKAKLAQELELMLKLFSQGLEALENAL